MYFLKRKTVKFLHVIDLIILQSEIIQNQNEYQLFNLEKDNEFLLHIISMRFILTTITIKICP